MNSNPMERHIVLIDYFTVLVLKYPLREASQSRGHSASNKIVDEMIRGGDFLAPPGHRDHSLFSYHNIMVGEIIWELSQQRRAACKCYFRPPASPPEFGNMGNSNQGWRCASLTGQCAQGKKDIVHGQSALDVAVDALSQGGAGQMQPERKARAPGPWTLKSQGSDQPLFLCQLAMAFHADGTHRAIPSGDCKQFLSARLSGA
jgi:hypothetical protein